MNRYASYLSSLSRINKVALQAIADAALVFLSFYGAMALRLDTTDYLFNRNLWGALVLASLVAIALYWLLGLYSSLVRYITERVLVKVAQGAFASALTIYPITALFGAGIPRSVPIIYFVLLFLSVGGLRFAARAMFRQQGNGSRKPVIVYGAGEAGMQVLNVLYHNRNYVPVALVDDDPRLQRLAVGGLRVFSPDDIDSVAAQTGAKTVLLAMEAVTRSRRREIVSSLQNHGLEIKTIPDMSEVIKGTAKLSEFRNIEPEQLLGRDPVSPDQDLLKRNISGKVVMVSGAGGSIGSELCRQILSLAPKSLILYEISEYALYTISAELDETARQFKPPVRIVSILGSVQDQRRLEEVVKSFQVQTIYHAAAYKHVPLVEENVVEGIRNNVFGTLTISTVARHCGVENFILISTDKAVRPTNVMGSTKRIAELICQAHAQDNTTTLFSMVRFGNVLGSSGSVIPRFRAQIEKGGPVTVTHRDINRYFMTIPEASQLVIQAGAMAKGGDVFVLDMGTPVRILDLAMEMIRLHGLIPYEVSSPDQVFPDKGDIPVCVTGLRKGEKLYEELLIGNNPAATQHPRVMTASELSVPLSELVPILGRLRIACESHDVRSILDALKDLPLEYTPVEADAFDVIWHESRRRPYALAASSPAA